MNWIKNNRKKILIAESIIIIILFILIIIFSYEHMVDNNSLLNSKSPDEKYRGSVSIVSTNILGSTRILFNVQSNEIKFDRFKVSFYETIDFSRSSLTPEDFKFDWKDDCVAVTTIPNHSTVRIYFE